MAAVFNPVGTVTKKASAIFSQCIQGAVAEQTVEFVQVNPSMTGKEFTLNVLDKAVMFHKFLWHRNPLPLGGGRSAMLLSIFEFQYIFELLQMILVRNL